MRNYENEIGIAVAIPNTSEEKMKAIVNLSEAIVALAKALSSINTEINISNCTINNSETGIKVDFKQHLK